MAIVINGSGTVTGISVGGLPDGIVDAGTLATNSVDSAELIDGAVDDSHMAAMAASKLTGALPAISGASLTGLTSTQMPSGSIVQFAYDFDGNYINLNTTSWVDTDLSISFTPKFSNSIIIVQAIFNMYTIGAGSTHGNTEIRLNKDGSLYGQEVSIYSGYGGTEALVVGTMPVYHAESQGNTNAEVYKCQVKNPNTTSGASHNQYAGHSALYIWEVKA
jgi:hypothetical protein